MSSIKDLLALTKCPHCGSKNVAIVPVPGGSLEFICDDCAEIWWHLSDRK